MTTKPININPDYFTLTTTQMIIALKEIGIPFSTVTGFFHEKCDKIRNETIPLLKHEKLVERALKFCQSLSNNW